MVNMKVRVPLLTALFETHAEETAALLGAIRSGNKQALPCAECQARLPLYLATMQGDDGPAKVAQDPELQAAERHLEGCTVCQELRDWLTEAAKRGLEPGNRQATRERLVSLGTLPEIEVSHGWDATTYGTLYWAKAQSEKGRHTNTVRIEETIFASGYEGYLTVRIRRHFQSCGYLLDDLCLRVWVQVRPGERVAIFMEQDRQTGEAYIVLVAGKTRKVFKGHGVLRGGGNVPLLITRVWAETVRRETMAYFDQEPWLRLILFGF